MNELSQAPTHMLIESSSDFSPCDMLKRRQDRVLHFSLDSHLHNSRSIPRELSRDQLENLLLTIKVFSLFMRARFFKALVWERNKTLIV